MCVPVSLWHDNLLDTHLPTHPPTHPPASSPLSHNSYQPGRVKVNTCFRWDMQIQTNASFRTAASQSSITLLEERAICPFLNTWTHKRWLLVSVALTDKESMPSLPPREHGQVCFLWLLATLSCFIPHLVYSKYILIIVTKYHHKIIVI